MAQGEVLAELILQGDKDFQQGMRRAESSVEGFNDEAAATSGPASSAAGSMGEVGSQADSAGSRIGGLRQRLGGLQDRMKSVGGRMQELGSQMSMFVSVPLAAAGVQALRMASDYEEMQAKMGTVFGDLTSDVQEWSQAHAEEVNRSAMDLQRYATQLQDTFVPMGFARDRAAEMSKEVAELGVDLASFNNMAEGRAMDKLQSGLVGNHEALREFGVMITQARLEQELLNMGIEGGAEAATEAQKAQARLNLVMQDTQDAQGDAARTSDSFANQLRGLKADLREVAVTVGQDLMPIARDLVSGVGTLVDMFGGLSDESRRMILVLGGVAAVAGPLLTILGTLAVVVGSLSAPIVAAVLAISAIIAVVVAFRSEIAALLTPLQPLIEEFRARLPGAMATARQALTQMLAAFRSFMQPIVAEIMPLLKQAIDEYVQTVMVMWQRVQVVLAFIQKLWQQHGEQIMAVVRPMMKMLSLIIRQVLDIIITTYRAFMAILRGDWQALGQILLGFWQRTWDRIKAYFSAAVDALINGIKLYADLVVGVWTGILDTLVGAVTGLGSTLLEAGKGLINSLTDGIKAAASAPVDAVKDVAGSIRDHLPFSDAKKGPLSRLTAMGASLPQTLRDGIASAANAPVESVEDFAASIRDRLPFSPARAGPLSSLDQQGAAVPGTVADGIRSNQGEAIAATEGMSAGVSQAMEEGMMSSGSMTAGSGPGGPNMESIIGKMEGSIQDSGPSPVDELGGGSGGSALGSGGGMGGGSQAEKVEIDARIMPGAVKVEGGLTEDAQERVREMLEDSQEDQIREIERLFGVSAIR